MPEEENNKNPQVLFYIANYFVFRSGPIGYLYDICQTFPTVFLSEKLDPETEKVVIDKNLFPKLEKIIPVRQFSGKKMNLFAKNVYLYRLAKNVLSERKPDILVCSSDTHSLFEMYLMRFAKRKNILKITVQTGNVGDNATIEKRVDLTNAYLRFPKFLPFGIRFLLAKFRKYSGHLLYYWLLPILVGEKPFFGKSSYILYKGNSGMRDSDYQTVFSKKDYEIFRKDGVPAEKLYIVSHPLKNKTKDFFKKAFWDKVWEKKDNEKIATFLLPEDKVGFRRKDYSLVSEDEVRNARFEIVRLAAEILSGWTIYLKPHPDIVDTEKLINPFEFFCDRIKITDSKEPLDKYIEMSDIVIELPLAAGTALFTASLQCPEKPIISLDFNHEILGDYYKNFEGIKYIDSRDKFIQVLESIKNGRYSKKDNSKPEKSQFSNLVEFLNFLISKKSAL